jgi:peptidoglycan hydrolase CwlO-like protein
MAMGHLSRADSTEGLSDVRRALNRILYNQEIQMSGLTDLQANVAAQGTALTALTAEWTTFLADMTEALSNEDSDAAVEAAAQLVAQQTQAITEQTAAMQGADPVTGTAATAAATPPASTSETPAPAAT